MKTFLKLALVVAILSTLNPQLSTCFAQGTAFTYQGRLNDGANPASGNYDLRFAIYDASGGGAQQGNLLTNSATAVSNGLFTVTLDFGNQFPGADRWLEIAVRTNGGGAFSPLAPRQALTATPYAITAGNVTGPVAASQLTGTVPAANVNGTYGNPVNFNNGANSFSGTFYGQFYGSSFTGGTFTGQFLGDGGGLGNLNASALASGTIPAARMPGVALLHSNQTFTAQNVFQQGIGIGRPASTFAVDAQAAQAVARFVTTNNVFGGVLILQNQSTNVAQYLGAVNFNDPPGGTPGQIAYIAWNPTNANLDTMQFRVGSVLGLSLLADSRGDSAPSLVGGYSGNQIVNENSGGNVIAGGGFSIYPNVIYSNSAGVFIGAGSGNRVGPQVNDSVIGGGVRNTVRSYNSVIGGGVQNTIETNAPYATIAGGVLNFIADNAYEAVIAGGNRNTNGNGAFRTFIGGGIYNSILANSGHSAILGGYQNTIGTNSPSSVIVGGNYSQISPEAVLNFIGGGEANFIDRFADHSFIGGGGFNWVGGSAAWPAYTVISGGLANRTFTNASLATIAGGSQNSIGAGSNSVVGGGWSNSISSGSGSVIAGGEANTELFGNGNVIGGGWNNHLSGNFSTISGGRLNAIGYGQNYSVIGGGFSNTNGGTFSVISGGQDNHVDGNFAVIPGGMSNNAAGDYAFAAGYRASALHSGSFVWADGLGQPFNSTTTNQFAVRATGGISLVTSNAGVTIDGQPIFSGNNGAALINVNALTLNGLSSSAFAPAVNSSSYIHNQTASPQTAGFNINGSAIAGSVTTTSLVTSNAQVTGLLRSGIESGTSETPSPAGLVIRRINSVNQTSNQIVAIARAQSGLANIHLIRDGTAAGFQIQYPTNSGNLTIACMGMDNTGASRNFYTNFSGTIPGTVQIYSNAQNIVHFQCTFGITFNAGQHLTQATLSRFGTDNFWSGNVISTSNQ